MPQNFVQIRPNYNKMENSVKKNVANGFHSLTKEDFSNLGDMTNHYSAADIARAGNDSINWYFQELLIATRFKETPDKDGKMKFEPYTINEEGTTITFCALYGRSFETF